MNTDLERAILGRRAAACAEWRWLPGMRAIVPDGAGGAGRAIRVGDGQTEKVPPDAYPDFDDAATFGCLIGLVRAAWRCPTVYARRTKARRASDGTLAWEVCDLYFDAVACQKLGLPVGGPVGLWGPACEIDALVTALERAP